MALTEISPPAARVPTPWITAFSTSGRRENGGSGGGSVRILAALAKPMAGSVLLGLGLGAMIAWPIGRLAAGLAPGVVTTDVRTALSVMAAMVVAGLAAGSWPALRAVRVSPCETLRAE